MTIFVPLIHDSVDQGDPFVLKVPDGHSAYTYYCYVTGGGDSSYGKALPTYGSNDLLNWTGVGRVLEAEQGKDHWAPYVVYRPELPEPFVMLYSRAIGTGEQGHVGHTIHRAVSVRPEGPFRTTGILTADIEFAIDPDIYQSETGELFLFFATDFHTGTRLGTGLAKAEISFDLSRIISPVSELARASADWHIYNPKRVMPWKKISGISWERGDTVCWHCIEAPAAVRAPNGRLVVFYSGGCFESDYAVGVLVEDESGKLIDRSGDQSGRLIEPIPELKFFAPGHGSVVQGHKDDELYFAFHARFGAINSNRQLTIAPILWKPEGTPYFPKLDNHVRGVLW